MAKAKLYFVFFIDVMPKLPRVALWMWEHMSAIDAIDGMVM